MWYRIVAVVVMSIVAAGCQGTTSSGKAPDGVVITAAALPETVNTVSLVNLQPGPLVWGDIVTTPNVPEAEWDWSEADALFTAAEAADVTVIVTLWPYALWDQASCHGDWPTLFSLHGDQFTAPYMPCDTAAYAAWVKAAAQRYGDRVAAWQIMRYPEQQTEPLAYFQGGAEYYVEIVRLSTAAITAVIPNATIVSATIGQPTAETITFWGPVFEQDSAQFFTALMVFADTPEQLTSTNTWLERYNSTLPQWVTTTTVEQAATFVDAVKVFYTETND